MVEGIVIQLQMEALDESADIETLLLKAYFVARKLQLKEFGEWISYEQNGYKRNVPDYRTVGGEIKAWNPYYGWIPVIFSGKATDIFNRMFLGVPISAISDAYNNCNGSVAFAVPGGMTELFNESESNPQTIYRFFSPKAELRKIISAVRNHILDWAILLEENGIIGEGLKFTDGELKTAHESRVIYNYTNNFFP
jgi:hypothetical protein